MNKLTNWNRTKDFFNSKKSNKIFTRAEVLGFHKKLSSSLRRNFSLAYLETCRCYLQRAGYLSDVELGVYRKLKPIPKNLTLTTLKREAYPKKLTPKQRVAKRREIVTKYNSKAHDYRGFSYHPEEL